MILPGVAPETMGANGIFDSIGTPNGGKGGFVDRLGVLWSSSGETIGPIPYLAPKPTRVWIDDAVGLVTAPFPGNFLPSHCVRYSAGEDCSGDCVPPCPPHFQEGWRVPYWTMDPRTGRIWADVLGEFREYRSSGK